MTAAQFALIGDWQSSQNGVLLGLFYKDFLPLEFWICDPCIRAAAKKAKPANRSAGILGGIGAIAIIGVVIYMWLLHGNLIVSIIAGLAGLACIASSVSAFNKRKRFEAIGDINKASLTEVSALIAWIEAFGDSIKLFVPKERGSPDPSLVQSI
jgi:hypothetical protein